MASDKLIPQVRGGSGTLQGPLHARLRFARRSCLDNIATKDLSSSGGAKYTRTVALTKDCAALAAFRIFGSFEPAIRLERFVEQDHIKCD
jgi:hypothetical protein